MSEGSDSSDQSSWEDVLRLPLLEDTLLLQSDLKRSRILWYWINVGESILTECLFFCKDVKSLLS
jgi:hypothetical protein